MGRIVKVGPEDGCVWVTGAASGIGAALTLLLARRGWRIAASDRNVEGLARVVAAAPAGAVVAVPVDVSDAPAVTEAVALIEDRVGPIALAVLNAGIMELMPAEAFSAALVRTQVETNLMGPVHCLDALLPRMRARGRGHLALTASMATYRGLPRMGAYGLSKAGLVNLAQSLKCDLDKVGLRIQVISPGFVRTPMLERHPCPLPYQIRPETAARRIAAGLASTRFEIAFPWPVIFCARVMRVLPGWLYYRLVR